MLDVFVLAFGLGLVFNAAPGAVSTESLRRGVRGGFRPAFGVQVGSLVGDATWAVLGLAGLGALFAVPALRVPLTVGGCLLLAWLGVSGVRDGLRSTAGPDMATVDPRGRGALGTGVSMSLSNPLNVVYWSGAAGAVSGALGDDATTGSLLVFFAGFMASSLLWCFVCAGAIALLRRVLPPLAVRIVDLACGAALLAFAALLLQRLVTDG
ncbi:LysE family translocator [Pseudonocardia aurantiaca]|uniref:LysE family transporter n=1 Tax=Pseudonocardia aurantiaca TaxID=75290 RepID=A0ABW4FE38_9PSEU